HVAADAPATPSALRTDVPAGSTHAARTSEPSVSATASSVRTVTTGVPRRASAPGSGKPAGTVNAAENAPAASTATTATTTANGPARTSHHGFAGRASDGARRRAVVVTAPGYRARGPLRPSPVDDRSHGASHGGSHGR